jgi:hypothetical protein
MTEKRRAILDSENATSGGTPQMKNESKKDFLGVASHALFGVLHAKVKRTGETGIVCYAIWSPEDETAQLFSVSVRFTDEDGKTRQEEYRVHAVEISSPNA